MGNSVKSEYAGMIVILGIVAIVALVVFLSNNSCNYSPVKAASSNLLTGNVVNENSEVSDESECVPERYCVEEQWRSVEQCAGYGWKKYPLCTEYAFIESEGLQCSKWSTADSWDCIEYEDAYNMECVRYDYKDNC
ncbi:MAG: hypothetical protein ABIC91_03505 [Nanoarchaeota archaeon]|nr:hypothetical protein [Nanoarchaeota archaeon]MBU1029648.1 hypothetical protein [Nanoarchaeota archaeon]MBU1849182.1 hypothetical protein [Nanoarchaeota archaeon]